MLIRIPRNTLLVLIGPAGCGKSTFAASHFSPSQIVSSDECRALISDDPSDQTVSHQAFELMHFIIDKRLRLGRLTVADATSLTRSSRRPFRRLAEKHLFNTAAIIFDVSLETCLERNRGRPRIVPHQAIALQHGQLSLATRDIRGERFDYRFVVGEAAQPRVKVEIGRRRPPGNSRVDRSTRD